MPPLAVMAQAWFSPADSAPAPLSRPGTALGTARATTPLPIWPQSFKPQQVTPPPAVVAHVWLPPAVTSMTRSTTLVASVGLPRHMLVPSASCRSALAPQHLRAPVLIA